MEFTPEQIQQAEAVLAARDEAKYWPVGTVVVSTTGWVTVASDYPKLSREFYRAASEAEIEVLKIIPEMKKAIEGGK